MFNVHRGLYFYNRNNKLEPHGAKNCSWSSKIHFDCELADKKWSDDSPITAEHYVYSYEQILKLGDESLADISSVQNLKALNSKTLRFTFKKRLKGFKHRLTSSVLAPRNKNKIFKTINGQLFSGPYSVASLSSKKINLSSNSYYDDRKRPDVEGVFVDDPSAALNMFESGKLDFLRYLESSNISAYSNVLFAPFAKLDGLFLNAQDLSLNARKALILALDFESLKKLYNSPSAPGCLAVPNSFFEKPIKCFEQDITKAKDFYKVSELAELKLKIFIPSADADEHKKLALWAREQWLKNLNLKVEIKLVEQKIFYSDLKKSKYTVYRKAHPLENLSCYDALRSLRAEPEFKEVSVSASSPNDDCRAFFKAALETYSWIPLGLPYYAHLPSKNFSGYYINLLGQFGLESLEKTTKAK